MQDEEIEVRAAVFNERRKILQHLEEWLEMPMLILSVVWLALFVIEMVQGIGPFLETVGNLVWAVFWIDFAIKFVLSPEKWAYLKSNWLTVMALALPALRIFIAFRAFRLLRAFRAARGLRLVRLLTSLSRGMTALGTSFGRRGFGYVLVLTSFVVFAGAAGMYSFENQSEGGLHTYADALWWTAMLLTSIGSDFFPRTGEGRLLCLVLSVYGFAVFGYMTAMLASFFLARDTEASTVEILGNLNTEIARLRQMLDERPLQR